MRSLWSTTHQQLREKNALLLVNQGPRHSRHLFPEKIQRNMDSSTLKILPPIIPHHHKRGQTLHRHRCRSYREHGRLRPPCAQMQVPYTTKTCKTSTPSSTPQPQPRQLQSQETSTEFYKNVMASINKQQSTITDSPTSTHTKLAEAINTTAPLILGKVGSNEPGWFQEASNVVEPLIERRNTAFAAHTSNPS